MRTTWSRIIAQGILTGVIGFLTVAVVFAIANMAAGRSPLYTAALLGATLFFGANDPSQVVVTPANVLAYTLLHGFVFLAFGVASSALASLADRGRQLWFVALFFVIFISFHLEAAVQTLAIAVRPAVSDVAIWVAGVAASAAMALYLLWAHPRIRADHAW
jgi:hypothetical protein